MASISSDGSAPVPPVLVWPGTFPSDSRLVLVDESTQPSGSLKHHTMRLVLQRLVASGRLQPGRRVVMASAGNAAIAGAHWCRQMDMPCTVVVPAATALAKTELIESEGAEIVRHFPPAAIYEQAQRIAVATGAFYLDHFDHGTVAAVAPDWPLAIDLFDRVTSLMGAPPSVLVAGLGSGATVAGLRAYTRTHGVDCRIIGVDSENSAYFPGWVHDVPDYGTGMPSRIEGIGRPVLPESFDRDSVDLVVQAPDAASVAGARCLRTLLDKPVGVSSGANLWAALREARRALRPEIIVTLIADAHSHYLDSCHDDAWCASKNLDPQQFAEDFRTAR